MSPERWRKIGELFDSAVSVSPSEREEWLRRACDGDDDLRADVAGLLAHDDWAEHDAFLSKPHETEGLLEQTPDWPAYNGPTYTDRLSEDERREIELRDESEGFLPKAAFAAGGSTGWRTKPGPSYVHASAR